VSYEGTFGTGSATGRVVTLGFGLETVWDDAERDVLIRKVLVFFGLLDEGEAMPSGLVLH
jgi:hypothetical protein